MNETLITLLVLILGVGGIALYVLNFKPRKKSKVKDLYAEGLDLLITGKRKAAYQNFKEIIQKDSENIKAYLKLGQVLREGGNHSNALKIHKGLLHRRKLTHYEQVELHKNLAMDYQQAGKIKLAVTELEALLKLEKNNEWAMSQLTSIYRKEQDWKKAGETFEKFVKMTGRDDKHKLSLFKIQEGRVLTQNKQFSDARRIYEEALAINENLAVAYYFIGNSYSEESEVEYQKSLKTDTLYSSGDEPDYMARAKELLSKAIPMWMRYAELKPESAWMVIHLLKDGLFALDRYPEIEEILKQILKLDEDNIEVIASLSEIYSHRGENVEALELIDSALEQDSTSLIVKLIKMKLQARQEKSSNEFIRGLDDIIHFLVTDERFQIYKNTATDPDIIWLYETGGKKEVPKA
ncbi:MAG: tetratricopeptide repeat protein [Candidatus Marinimicrobia bacterium]|jgi:lipopolysaccharide biosynthesis regulator YciM|nr:tetratricopeptide repeat protein [Candidatus Neomarinimicrobiota bacterium]